MPPTQPTPTDARTRILDAAETLVRAQGVSGLTLDAAAALAKVSKGGLLYHFASKEALLNALLKRLAAFIAEDFEAGVADQPEGPGRVARAMITWALGLPENEVNERCDRAAAVFLAAFLKPTVWATAVSSLFDAGRGLALALMLSGTALCSTLTPIVGTYFVATLGWRQAYLARGPKAADRAGNGGM